MTLTVLQIAVAAGLVQALGYLVYFSKSLRHEIEPNPSTWFMFAYGTAMLTILEWDRSAPFELLLLPIVCATLSIGIALICMKRGKLRWPKHWIDRFAFLIDLSLTIAYIWVWFSAGNETITEIQREQFVLLFLVLSNASTAVSFVPLLRETAKDPKQEHPLPWLIWTFAYGTLGYATHATYGLWSEFMIYPASNVLLHGLVCILALRTARR